MKVAVWLLGNPSVGCADFIFQSFTVKRQFTRNGHLRSPHGSSKNMIAWSIGIAVAALRRLFRICSPFKERQTLGANYD
ncbi:MAG: hypothetical protein L0Z07_00205 [Planctomycetes bacterium]|nr:hypothetical protein [Planctomycetota bacterium]